MKKYWFVILFFALIGVLFFWIFLKEVEKNGAAYGMLDLLYVVLWGIGSLLALILNAGYWVGIANLLDRYIKKKAFLYMAAVLYFVLGIWLEIKLINGAMCLDNAYKDYMEQKKFEYKYKIE